MDSDDTGLMPSTDASASAPGNDAAEALRLYRLRNRINGAAGWLFLIGAFTLANALLWAAGSGVRMIVGLIATRLLVRYAAHMGPAARVIVVGAAICAAAAFTIFGLLVRARKPWALWAGTALYAADFALMFVALGTQDVFSLAFHALGLGFLLGAIPVIKALTPADEQRLRAMTVPTVQTATGPSGVSATITGVLCLMFAAATLAGLAWFVFAAAGATLDQGVTIWASAMGAVLAGIFVWIGMRLFKAGRATTAP